MTEEQKKQNAKAIIDLLSGYSKWEQLGVLGYAAALKSAELTDSEAEAWFDGIGVTRMAIKRDL